jgi:hypothetical protein
MRGDLTIRKTKTASGAIAVQVVRNVGKRRDIVQHIGSAHDATALSALLAQAQTFVERHCAQPNPVYLQPQLAQAHSHSMPSPSSPSRIGFRAMLCWPVHVDVGWDSCQSCI